MNTIQFVIRLFMSLFGPRFYATGNLDAADLAAVASGGLINESLMQRIWEISRIPLPLSDRVSSDDTKNDTHAWTQDVLAVPDLTNALIDGQDTDAINDTSTGDRVQNFHQISAKVVQVSSRADASDTVGKAEELAYQVMMRQRELRRDREAIALTQQASLKDTGAAAGNVGAICRNRLTRKPLPATASTITRVRRVLCSRSSRNSLSNEWLAIAEVCVVTASFSVIAANIANAVSPRI